MKAPHELWILVAAVVFVAVNVVLLVAYHMDSSGYRCRWYERMGFGSCFAMAAVTAWYFNA